MGGVGIDLGTSNILIYVKKKGIVLREPSVAALTTGTDKVICIGKEAKKMQGKTNVNITLVHPMHNGVITDFSVTQKILHFFIRKVLGYMIIRPIIVMGVPSGITEVEARAVVKACMKAGARDVYLIEEPMAAAIGAGLKVGEAHGNMIIDIGGGTTDIAVISLGKVVLSESIKVAGDAFNDAIIKYVRKFHNLIIGDVSAEEIKVNIGCAYKRATELYLDVKGRCAVTGLPRIINLSSSETVKALEEPLNEIHNAVHSVLEKTSPELISDITGDGIVMTGGGSLLYGIDKNIEGYTGIRTYISDDPLTCVVYGTGKLLDNLKQMSDYMIRISRVDQT